MSLTTIKLTKILLKLNADFVSCSDTYESIDWKENASNIPTESEINAEILAIESEISFNVLRKERDRLLDKTDKYIIPDFAHPSEEVKQAWITYRQELRDLPATATPQLDENGNLTNVTWPTPPS
tara:strand:+ start:1823 stop:2197 length:375 start_codon:yes stop_codon:yes gene_type:complete